MRGEKRNGNAAAVGALAAGALMWGGGTATGRRVMVPWGSGFAALNAQGQTLMKRTIEWAASMEKP